MRIGTQLSWSTLIRVQGFVGESRGLGLSTVNCRLSTVDCQLSTAFLQRNRGGLDDSFQYGFGLVGLL